MADMVNVSRLDLVIAWSWAAEVIDPHGERPQPQQIPNIERALNRIEKALEGKD